jgi:transcriptional regulator with XRE-family HTH domain
MAKKRHKEPPTDFGRRLDQAVRDMFGERGQTRAAAAMGMVPQQLNKYIQGRNEPLLDVLVRIANGLGVSIDWLVTGEGPMQRDYASWQELPDWIKEIAEALHEVEPAQRALVLRCIRLLASHNADVLETFPRLIRSMEGLLGAAAALSLPMLCS